MNKASAARILCFWLLMMQTGTAQDKLAQTGFQFLSVGGDARAVAMGEAFTTINGYSSSLFYNPAMMAIDAPAIDVALNQNNWIAGIKHNSGSLSYSPAEGRFGVIGFSFMAVDYGNDIIGTVVAENNLGYEETGTLDPSAFLVGMGYAIQLSDRFSIGAHLKYVYQSLGESLIPTNPQERDPDEIELGLTDNTLGELAFDFGTYYRTGYKSLTFGMAVRNFSREIQYAREGFQLPLTFKIGFAIDAVDFLNESNNLHSLMLAFDAVHPRAYPEFVNLGGEYIFNGMFALRSGYAFNQSEYGLTAGFGVSLLGLTVDVAYTPFDAFEDVTRFTARFTF